MNKRVIDNAGKVIADNIKSGKRNCVLALIDLDGSPTASVISPSKADGIKWITFCTGLNWNKPARIEKCNRACVCFGTAEHNITLIGTIEVVTDDGIKLDMWYKGLETHFSGPDDPNYCVLKFTTERYNLIINWEEATGTL